MKTGFAGALALGVLVFAGVGLGAASFSDKAGDDNAAPDVTSVSVSESPAGVITVAVAVANFQTLPSNSWFNVWFDLDNDDSTGDPAGDDALVRYLSDGTVEHHVWSGSRMEARSTSGMAGRFEAGALTLTFPKSALGAVISFGLLVVSSRAQVLGGQRLIASDFAPNRGRSLWTSPVQSVFPDPENDHNAAPDITAVDVIDTQDGWIRFAISTPNRATLPGTSVVVVSIDRDSRPSTGDGGAEVAITNIGGEVQLERWNAASRSWVDDTPPTRVRARSAAGVVTIDVHRSELDNVSTFGFKLVSADLNPATGGYLAIDFAPDSGAFWRYTLENAPALRLIAGQATGSPVRPRAGRPFTISLAVRRSDTKRAITSGTVACNITAGGKPVSAAGRVRSGKGQCKLVIPRNASEIGGSMTVRSGGKAVAVRISFTVR